jgi:8-oxoguanine deaminase
MNKSRGSSLLIQGASAILTGLPGHEARCDPAQGLDIRIRGEVIESIGRLDPSPGEHVIDAQDCVVYPGWINTHHHLFQSLLKGIPAGIDQPLVQWLSSVPVRYRQGFDQELMFRLAARIGLIELLLSGCTTVADHQYHNYPNMPFDPSAVVFDEAQKLGMRMVLCRGGATKMRVIDQAPPAQAMPESFDAFMQSIESTTARFHQAGLRPMRRVVSAITTPTWSAEPGELIEMARQARRLGIGLHSHLSETHDYLKFCAEVHGLTPMQFVEAHEWVGPDVWFAHMVHLDEREIERCARTKTGIAHCPQSNARLGSGIAPVPAMLAAGVKVSLAVDGAASNEAADMISEAHACWLMHRANPAALAVPAFPKPQPGGQAWAMSVEQVINIATAQGAEVMGLEGLGSLRVGMAADLAIYRLDDPRYLGLHDPAIGPVVAGGKADLRAVIINGAICLEDNQIAGIDLSELAAHSRAAVRSLANLF